MDHLNATCEPFVTIWIRRYCDDLVTRRIPGRGPGAVPSDDDPHDRTSRRRSGGRGVLVRVAAARSEARWRGAVGRQAGAALHTTSLGGSAARHGAGRTLPSTPAAGDERPVWSRGGERRATVRLYKRQLVDLHARRIPDRHRRASVWPAACAAHRAPGWRYVHGEGGTGRHPTWETGKSGPHVQRRLRDRSPRACQQRRVRPARRWLRRDEVSDLAGLPWAGDEPTGATRA
jgi:hypothetical protein